MGLLLSLRRFAQGLRPDILAAALVLGLLACGMPATAQDPLSGEWAATWQASPEPQRANSAPVSNQTVRQIVRVSIGGPRVRIRFTNEFSDKPLTIGAAHVAIAGIGPSIAPGTDRVLTFNGKPTVTISPNARVVSDPVELQVAPLASLAVSIYVPTNTAPATEHFFALQTSYVVRGDVTGAPSLTGATPIARRLFLSGVEVPMTRRTKVVVALGDSLTDGFGSKSDANTRWPDLLAQILAGRKGAQPVAVVNAGIGGNRLLHDFIGPNVLSRFDRDVLSQSKVSHLIVLIGINDFGLPGGRNLPEEDVTADEVIAGYRQLIARARTAGIKIFGATLPPFGPIPDRPGYSSPASQAKRDALNQWIRTSGSLDGVIDFDAALRDPADPKRMLPAYDSGDHLHPNDTGYWAMANAVPLKLFN